MVRETTSHAGGGTLQKAFASKIERNELLIKCFHIESVKERNNFDI